MWTANLASQTGTWMQNVVLPAYVYARTDSAGVVGVLVFAQLGPLLLLSVPAGVIADRFRLLPWLLFGQGIQMSFSILLGLATQFDMSVATLFAMQLGVGIGNALHLPAASSLMPSLVPPRDIGGAVSLNSVAVNGSRVVGPIIVAVLMGNGATTAQIFYLNAATYLFTIVALLRIRIPEIERRHERGLESFLLGLRIARNRPVLARILLTMTSFSFLSLPFVGLFPAVSRLAFGIDERSATYKWLFATWGLGAMVGALSVGTVFAATDKRVLVRRMFALFAASMCVFALSRSAVPAFASAVFLGFGYFGATTSLLTVLQSRLRADIRPRVLALWFMAFGGTVPIGNMAFGPVIDAIGPRPVLMLGAAWAAFLVWWCDIAALDRRREAARSPGQ
jgi:MFS family permease